MANLKPCPFCGAEESVYVGKDDEVDDARPYTVCCDFTLGGCGASTGYAETPKEAIAMWNRRAKESE